MRVQLTLNQVSLCCYAAMHLIDRWVCRRKVRGALEVAVELWDGGGGSEHRSHSRSHHAIHTNRLMHRHRHTNLQMSKFSAHMDAFAHIAQINTGAESFSPLPFSTYGICTNTFTLKWTCMGTHTYAPARIVGKRRPVCPWLQSSWAGSLSSLNCDSH